MLQFKTQALLQAKLAEYTVTDNSHGSVYLFVGGLYLVLGECKPVSARVTKLHRVGILGP